MENEHTLNAVTVTGKRDGSLFGTKAKGFNECGDYVCVVGFLNCKYHYNDHGNQPPVVGSVYFDGSTATSLKDPNLSYITYNNCMVESPFVFRVSGIYLDRGFYGVNLEDQDLAEPGRAGILLDKKGEAGFSFFTGDITGDFTILVQGVGEGDLISGTGKLTVN